MTSTGQAAPGIASQMVECAAAWLAALDQDQRDKASLDFDDTAERTSWACFPRMSKGLSLLETDARQQKLAHRLIAAALSIHAYTQVTTVMALESMVNLIEDGRMDAFRDPRRYFLSIFGTPGYKRWGWRFEGHHVVLNFTLVDGEIVSPTPLFIGAQPSHTMRGDAVVMRPCGLEEDAARELLGSLDAEQRRAAVICEAPPPDFVLMNAPFVPETCLPGEMGSLPPIQAMAVAMRAEQREALRFERAQPRGLPAAEMDDAQRRVLSELVRIYVDRLPDSLAMAERARIDLNAVHFAWAGEECPRRPHYYRLQGGSFIVECDNTQNDANHVHTVWRDAERDFGADVLRTHVSTEH